MIHHSVKRVTTELEKLTRYNISVERALDLIEASTEDLNDLIAINTMREISQELATIKAEPVFSFPLPFELPRTETFACQS